MPNFDTIRSVPAEIICAILVAAGVNYKTTTRTWMKALSFLWVCRKWRLVAEPILYSMLIYGNEPYYSRISNYKLFLQRRQFNNVKHIIVSNAYLSGDGDISEVVEYPDDIVMMMNFGTLIGDNDAKKDIEILDLVARGSVFAYACNISNAVYYEYICGKHDFDYFDQYGNKVIYDEGDLDAKRRNASINIASKLAALCPNVTHLSFNIVNLADSQIILANVLINYYIKQLVNLECNIQGIDFELKDGHKIQSLVLGDLDANCRQLPQLLPNVVKNLGLLFKGDFCWDLFKRSDLAPVSYANLIRLELIGNEKPISGITDITAPDSQSVEYMPLDMFPKLHTLVIRNKILSYASLKYLLQFPVKVLCIDGYVQHACQLNKHDLDNIDRLILKFCWEYFLTSTNAAAEFIQQTNILLAKADKIAEIHIKLKGPYQDVNWACIKWFHLTHLYIYVCDYTFHLIAVIPTMSSLQSLVVEFSNKDIWCLHDDVVNPIKKLRPDGSEPAQSIIKTVPIKWARDYGADTLDMEEIKKLKEDVPVIQYSVLE